MTNAVRNLAPKEFKWDLPYFPKIVGQISRNKQHRYRVDAAECGI